MSSENSSSQRSESQKQVIPERTRNYRHQLGQRINRISVERFDTKREAAHSAGVNPEQMTKWIRGDVSVGADKLVELARAAGCDPVWLLLGESYVRKETIDPIVLHTVLVALAQAMQSEKLTYNSPEQYANLVRALHDYVRETPEAVTSLSGFLRAMLTAQSA